MLVHPYTIIILITGILFFIVVVGALYWAQKSGQFRNFGKGARSIFTPEEPEGVITDKFPEKKNSKTISPQSNHSNGVT